jgi:hypothetical protein
MSTRELERAEAPGRVAKGGLKLLDAAVMRQLSYRQVKRLWRRYQEVGWRRAEAWQCRPAVESEQGEQAAGVES